MRPLRLLSLATCLLAGFALPAAAQSASSPATPSPGPPLGDAMVRASNQVADVLAGVNNAPAQTTGTPAAPSLQPDNSKPQADVLAEAEAETQAKAAAEADARNRGTNANNNANAEVVADEPLAATDALAKALAEQARRAAEQAAAFDAQQEQARIRATQQAFEAAKEQNFPLTPEQIRQVMEKYEAEEYAKVPPAYGQPKPEIAVTTVSLDPGAEPPEIKVHSGFVTTVAILDGSGQPWPIQDIGVGGNFDIPSPESGSHIIRISPLSQFGFGNLSIRLKDLSTPVTFRLSAGNDIVHYRYDARIPKMGPNARTALIQKPKLVAADDIIMSVLDNTIPVGTKKLKVSGTDKRTAAYIINERVFVRTPLTLLSPSWHASVSSADGTTVYEVGETPVLLLSDQGQMVRARISDDAS